MSSNGKPLVKIRVGHSPDPDDAFMFYAIAGGLIPLRGFEIEHVIEDIETLNQRALRAELEVTAVSCHAYAYLTGAYAVLRSGASVGDRYGPVLVAKDGAGGEREPSCSPAFLKNKKVAIPGKLTTAYLVLGLFASDFQPVFVPFDQIPTAVASGHADFGLLIHEGQITYARHGLCKVMDLGLWWYHETGLPLTLGVDIIRRDLGEGTIREFAALFRESILFAMSHRKAALHYAMQYGRGIDETLTDRFVGMYVNHYTEDLNENGMEGFRRLFTEAHKKNLIPHLSKIDFI